MPSGIIKKAIETATTLGFQVFPVHGVDEFGLCTCGNSSCTNAGKHPACPNGLKDALTDPTGLLRLFNEREHINYGIRTGQESGVFVVDLDGQAAQDFFYMTYPNTRTLTATTARGRHLFFKYPDFKIKTIKGFQHEKIDIRGEGGYVVGAGSTHASGKRYEWLNELEEIEQAPQALLSALCALNEHAKLQPTSLALVNHPAPVLSIGQNFTAQDIESMLKYISPDIGYDEWVKIGMALHNNGHSFSMWDAWSSGGSKYQGSKDLQTHWRSFGQGKGVSLGTIVHMAKQAGWKPQSSTVYSTIDPMHIMHKVQESVVNEQFDPITGELLNDHTGGDGVDALPVDVPAPLIPKTGMFYIKACDIHASLDCNDFVQNTLGDEKMSVIYGESNCGKTFFMSDIAFHVARGKEWRGLRVDQGAVIYTALEGARGFANRIAAYRQHNMILGTDMPLAVVPSPVDFLDPQGNILEYIELVKRASGDIGQIKLIVVDTLARAIAGGDENSGQDMGRLVGHADALRYATGAHVAFVHHSGKDKARGARGHSSLRAAVDTEIEISREEGASFSVVKIAKQRDMEIGKDMAFSLRVVTLGQNRHGEDVTSCVVEPYDIDTTEKTKARLSPRQDFVYRAIVIAVDKYGSIKSPVAGMPEVKTCRISDMGAVLNDMGFAKMITKDGTPADPQVVKSSTQAARIELQKKGYIAFNESNVWVL